MPGPEQVTDLPAPPQEGCPMRPAGGEGLLAPGVLVLASWREQEVSGRRRRLAVAGLGLIA
jgi:hypothetical protein